MRFIYIFLGITILGLSSTIWCQEAGGPMQGARMRRQQMQLQRQQRQQNPDFTPDPPPTEKPAPQIQAPTPTPTPLGDLKPLKPQAAPAEQLLPATPPQVTFRDGLLTVIAPNSNLNSLLLAIRNKAGVQFEGLENGIPERIAITMGPAPEGDVLAAILGGSNFDYVVVERPDSPGIVQKVVLSPKGGASAAAGGAQASNNASADAEDDEEAAEEPVAPQDTPVRPPIAQLPTQQQQPNPQQATPPTAEQILEKLKQQEAQQGQPAQNAPLKPPRSN